MPGALWGIVVERKECNYLPLYFFGHLLIGENHLLKLKVLDKCCQMFANFVDS